MDSGNVFELFSQAVNEGDIVQLDKILNYFKTINVNMKMYAERFNSPFFKRKNKLIPMDFITKPVNKQYGTCLEVASKNGHWDILRILLKQFKYHVYEKRKFISNPPFNGRSAVFREKDKIFFRDICSQIPITKLVENLISFDEDYSVWLEFILDALMSSSITRADKIVALELMGAVFVFWLFQYRIGPIERHLPDICLSKGIQCWKDALILRDATADGEPAIPNIPCVLPERLQNVFGMEEMTLEELEQIERLIHSNIDWFNEQFEPIEIQALLISYKILKRQQSNNGKTSLIYFFYKKLLDYAYSADTYRSRRDLIQVTNVLLFFIETFCDDISNVLSSYQHYCVFICSFSFVKKYEFTSDTLLIIAKCTLKIFANLKPQSFGKFYCLDSEIWRIYDSMSDCFRIMNQQDQSKLMNYFSNYIGDFN